MLVKLGQPELKIFKFRQGSHVLDKLPPIIERLREMSPVYRRSK